MTSDEPSIDNILAIADGTGLPLTEAEAAELVKGLTRMREMAQQVRELLDSTTEPAVVFSPQAERSR
jgi:1-carboxybiuret hydrolase subunit AtzG-like